MEFSRRNSGLQLRHYVIINVTGSTFSLINISFFDLHIYKDNEMAYHCDMKNKNSQIDTKILLDIDDNYSGRFLIDKKSPMTQ